MDQDCIGSTERLGDQMSPVSGFTTLLDSSFLQIYRIPRKEVEEMNHVVMHELNKIEPGCVSTIVGGSV